VSPTADKLLDQEWRVLLINLTIELTNVLHQREVLQVWRAINAQLSLQIIAASIDVLTDGFIVLSQLSDSDCVFLTCRYVHDILAFECATQSYRTEDGLLGVVWIHVQIRVWQLLHTIEAPTVELTVICNRKRVSKAASNLDDGLFYWNKDRLRVPLFEEWRNVLSVGSSLTTLAKSVITHCIDLSLLINR
jgi:hypothetical protein